VEAKVKLTVLVDNNTLNDRPLVGEAALAHFIEAEGKKILFDVGYSDAFVTNATKLHLDLLDVDFVVLSHGHLDHTWGLVPLARLYTEALMDMLPAKKPTLVAHPRALSSRTHENLPEIGSLLGEERLSEFFRLRLSREPVWITQRLVFLGEIKRRNDFEAKTPLGKIREDGVEKDDFLFDDSALAYKSPEGLVIITGCSHAGICNIVEQAREVCGEDRVADIVGGLHLLDPSAEQLQGTMEYLRALRPGSMHAGHCTDLKSKVALSRVVQLKEVGAGLTLKY
jgi:7,8-dihydropterin-6-yl-methyl-4-(beta-D-ribofuranosyl)aminobenzene 5'-phosphate synthase